MASREIGVCAMAMYVNTQLLQDGPLPMEMGRPLAARRPVFGAAFRTEVGQAQREMSAPPGVELTLDQYTTLLDAIHDAVLLRAMDGRIIFWNRGAAETHGWS